MHNLKSTYSLPYENRSKFLDSVDTHLKHPKEQFQTDELACLSVKASHCISQQHSSLEYSSAIELDHTALPPINARLSFLEATNIGIQQESTALSTSIVDRCSFNNYTL